MAKPPRTADQRIDAKLHSANLDVLDVLLVRMFAIVDAHFTRSLAVETESANRMYLVLKEWAQQVSKPFPEISRLLDSFLRGVSNLYERDETLNWLSQSARDQLQARLSEALVSIDSDPEAPLPNEWQVRLAAADRALDAMREARHRRDGDFLERISRHSPRNDKRSTLARGKGGGGERDPDRYAFRRRDNFWLITFEGRAVIAPDSRGMRYIAFLLAHPNVDADVTDLASIGRKSVANLRAHAASSADAGLHATNDFAGIPILDDQALRELRQSIKELDAEIDEASQMNNPELATRLTVRKQQIEDEILKASGLRGRKRRFTGNRERARNATAKAIHRAIDNLATLDAPLAEFLETAIDLGVQCSYRPKSEVDWVLS